MPRHDKEGSFAAVNAATGEPMELAMQRLWLTGEVLPVGARLWVQHEFQSKEEKPLEVIYAFPLPRDAALRRFVVKGERFSIQSSLKPVGEAEEEYEAGMERGHLSALARLHRDGLVNLMLGNLRPGELVTVSLEVIAGVETRDDGLRFRFPFTLAPSYHSKARSSRLESGRGEIELPEEQFGNLILPVFSKDASDLHQVGFDLAIRTSQEVVEIASPSHGIRVSKSENGVAKARLATEGELPNRDLVLEARTKKPTTQVLSGLGEDGRGCFAAIVPSGEFGEAPEEPRRVVFVLDRSGSMMGGNLEQARRAIEACLGLLSPEDEFGLIAFDDELEAFRPQPDSGQQPAPRSRLRAWLQAISQEPDAASESSCSLGFGTRANRDAAQVFLEGVEARGGTELGPALLEAIRALGNSPGDVFLVTDGQVFGSEDILQKVGGRGVYIHCLGIGSASQDRFLSLLARRTGGVSRFLTPRERVDLEAVDLFASICRPVAANLDAKLVEPPEAGLAPKPAAKVFPGDPLVLMGQCAAQGPSRIELAWECAGQRLRRTIGFEIDQRSAETLRLIQGARLITDLESELTTDESAWMRPRSEPKSAAERRENRVQRRLETLGQEYGLANRALALVAVVEREGDREGEIPETRIVSVGMPEGTAFSAYFGAPAMSRITGGISPMEMLLDLPGSMPLEGCSPIRASLDADSDGLVLSDFIPHTAPRRGVRRPTPRREVQEGPDLLDLARQLEPDGGMPGDTKDERLLASVLALLAFLAEGHTKTSGAFRAHVKRLTAYLEEGGADNETVDRVLALAAAGTSLPGDWLRTKPIARAWEDIEAALAKLSASSA